MSSSTYIRSMSRTVLLSAVGAALALSVGVARAETQSQLVVNYADLNLAVEADAARLYARLERAARSVCDVRDERELVRRKAALACERSALADAVAQVDSAMLTALHQADVRFAVARASYE